MPEYDFTLKFKLSNSQILPESVLDRLYQSGCDDALIGIGKPGYLGLNFVRESTSAYEAIQSAVKNVRSVLKNAILVSVAPDLVGITDIATFLNCSRQNVRKLLKENKSEHPRAIYEGAQSIWHLAPVLDWLVEKKAYSIEQSLIDTATVAMNINLAIEHQSLDPELQFLSQALIAS